MLETSAKGAQPRGEEAQRVLSVFAASLKNPTLVRAAGRLTGRRGTCSRLHDALLVVAGGCRSL